MMIFSVKRAVAHQSLLGLTLFAVLLCLQAPATAQRPTNNSATEVLAPVRAGDKVEVKYLSSSGWIPGTVISVEDGSAEVEFERAGTTKSQKFRFDKIRFPNGEGQWAMWKTKDKKINVAARYIARDEKEVMVRTAEGKELTIAINDLVLNLKQRVKASPITGQENVVNGVVPFKVGDSVMVQKYSNWHSGVVQSLGIGEAEVEYTRTTRSETGTFTFNQIRFPNGEWQWENWSDVEGTVNFEGRFISRDATKVTIRKTDGTDFRLPIDELAPRLRRRVLAVRDINKINHVNGADPFRPGDEVQVVKNDLWYEGVVTQMKVGKATVTYKGKNGEKEAEDFTFGLIRFPNGEGRWREWKSANGKFKIIGRYISRTKTHVTIRKLDGSDVTVPNQSLSTALRRILGKTPITGAETLIGGVNPIRVGDEVEVRTSRSRYSSSRGTNWTPGVILESHPEHALVEVSGSKKETKIFKFVDIRYPNGEGAWQKWDTDDGEFKIIARYIRRTVKNVTLIKENGKSVDVPIDRLSTKLKRIVNKLPVVAITPEQIEFQSGRNVTSFLGNPPSFQEFTATFDPIVTIESFQGGVGIPLTYGDNVSEATPLTDVPTSFGLEKPWYALGTYATTSFDRSRWTQLFWVCPSKEAYEQGPCFQPEEQIVDYSGKQQRLINLVLTDDHSEPIGFRTYKVNPLSREAQPEFAWTVPRAKKSRYGRTKKASYKVELVGDNQLLLSSSNSVALHDFAQKRVVYTIPDVTDGHFALHPSKRFFAVIKEGIVALIDVQTGKQLAAEKTSAAGVGFSLDGNKLVVIDSKLRIWDLRSNAEPSIHERRNLLEKSSGPVVMIDDKWIKAGSQLYSLVKEIIVWKYAGSGVSLEHDEMLGEMNLLAAHKSATITVGEERIKQTLALVGLAKVPHPPAVEALGKLEKLEMLMLKPGSGVRIEIEGDRQVRDGVLAAIQKAGWHEDPTADVLIKAYAKKGKPERVQYGIFDTAFGRPLFNQQPKNVVSATGTPWLQGFTIFDGEKSAWTRSRVDGPPHNIDTDESVQSQVAKATQPNFRLFENLNLPKEIIAPKYRNGLGLTSITINGFVDRLYAEIPEEELEDDDTPEEAPK